MAARRERERRRPNAERRYRFAAPEPELLDENSAAPGDALVDDVDTEAVEAPSATTPERNRRIGRGNAIAPPASTRGGVRPTAMPFSAYKDEYAYVYRDLRRVGVVIGGLLVALIALYFVLPVLVH